VAYEAVYCGHLFRDGIMRKDKMFLVFAIQFIIGIVVFALCVWIGAHIVKAVLF
jgi:hypothetical protein